MGFEPRSLKKAMALGRIAVLRAPCGAGGGWVGRRQSEQPPGDAKVSERQNTIKPEAAWGAVPCVMADPVQEPARACVRVSRGRRFIGCAPRRVLHRSPRNPRCSPAQRRDAHWGLCCPCCPVLARYRHSFLQRRAAAAVSSEGPDVQPRQAHESQASQKVELVAAFRTTPSPAS
jgi:hypothetical protein